MENRFSHKRNVGWISGVLVMARRYGSQGKENDFEISFDYWDLENLNGLLTGFSGKAMREVRWHAINKTLKQMRTQSVREVTKVYTIKANNFRNRVDYQVINSEFGILTAIGPVVKQTDFKYTARHQKSRKQTIVKTKSGFAKVYQTRWTITSEIKRGETHTIQDAFMRYTQKATGTDDDKRKKQIFVRHYDDAADLQLGPSVPVMMGQHRVLESIVDYGGDKLADNLTHEINRRLQGWGYK